MFVAPNPRKNRVGIQDHGQIDEAPAEPDVGDIGNPDVIGILRVSVFEQIGIAPMRMGTVRSA